jgi:hypothetical protein
VEANVSAREIRLNYVFLFIRNINVSGMVVMCSCKAGALWRAARVGYSEGAYKRGITATTTIRMNEMGKTYARLLDGISLGSNGRFLPNVFTMSSGDDVRRVFY